MGKNIEKKRKKKRVAKPVIIVLLGLFLAIGSMAAYAYGEEIAEVVTFVKNNISAVFYALTNSSEDVSAKKEENEKKQQELLEQIAVETMRDLSEEERMLLAEGKLTYEEALALIRGETLAPATTEVIPDVTEAVEAPEEKDPPKVIHTPGATGKVPAKTSAAALPTTTEPEVTAKVEETIVAEVTTVTETTTIETTAVTEATTTATAEIVIPMNKEEAIARQQEIIAEIYLLRSLYLNEIDKLIENGKAEYNAMPKEKKTLKTKMAMADRMLKDGNQLEKDCDAKMDALLAELKIILESQSLDTGIIDEILSTYKEQKKIKKTELYNEYSPKLK